MKLTTLCILVLLTVNIFTQLASCKKIGLLAFMMKSHMNELDGVGVELLNRGHEVVYIGAKSLKDHIKDSRYRHLNYETPESVESEEFIREMLDKFINGSGTIELVFTNKFKELCSNTAGNKVFMDKIKAENFDIFLVDSLPIFKCFFLVAHHSGAPYVGVGTHFMAWNARFPFIGASGITSFPIIKNTFLDRIKTFAGNIAFEFHHLLTLEYSKYSKAIEVEFPHVEQIADRTKMWLVNQEPVLEQPFAVPSHMVLVGGLGISPTKPLTGDWLQWADAGPFVVISFGSMMEYQPAWLANKISESARLLPNLRFVVRISGKEAELYQKANVRTSSWLPQSDLLAHPNCVVFVTHCGNNGQQEALREAVPMVGLPLFGDQPHNSQRIVDRGFGIRLDIKTFHAKNLALAVETLSQKNASQRILLKRASKIFRRRLNPRIRAADAVEEVLRGDADLIYPSGAYDLNFIQFHLLDVFLAIALLVLSILLLIVCTLWFCLRKIFKMSLKKQKVKTN